MAANSRYYGALLFIQDANECWLQMMRVLQQKLEPLEPETAMEVMLKKLPNLFFFCNLIMAVS